MVKNSSLPVPHKYLIALLHHKEIAIWGAGSELFENRIGGQMKCNQCKNTVVIPIVGLAGVFCSVYCRDKYEAIFINWEKLVTRKEV